MKWIAIVLAAVVILVALMALAGSLLPREHKAIRKASYRQPVSAVWDLLTNPQDAASWRSDLAKVEKLPDQNGFPAWRETWKDGNVVLMERILFEPEWKLQTRIASTDLPFGGTWTFELTPKENGCQLQITEDGFVSNPIFRLLAKFVFGHTGSMEAYLRSLGAKFGETTVWD